MLLKIRVEFYEKVGDDWQKLKCRILNVTLSKEVRKKFKNKVSITVNSSVNYISLNML